MKKLYPLALAGVIAAMSIVSVPGAALAAEPASPAASTSLAVTASTAPPVLKDVRVLAAPEILYVNVKTDEFQRSWHRAYADSERLAEFLGLGTPDLDPALDTISFRLPNGRIVRMTSGVPAAFVDGKIIDFDAAPLVTQNNCGDKRILVPVRLLAEIAGYGVAQSSDGSVVVYR